MSQPAYICPRCRKSVRAKDQVPETGRCRWCEWNIEVELGTMLKDPERIELATLRYRRVSVVTLATMGGWTEEYEMLKGAFG